MSCRATYVWLMRQIIELSIWLNWSISCLGHCLLRNFIRGTRLFPIYFLTRLFLIFLRDVIVSIPLHPLLRCPHRVFSYCILHQSYTLGDSELDPRRNVQFVGTWCTVTDVISPSPGELPTLPPLLWQLCNNSAPRTTWVFRSGLIPVSASMRVIPGSWEALENNPFRI